MAYITYCDYKELGGTVSESAFPLLEIKARYKLDSFTQNRLVNVDIDNQIEQVKLTMTEFIETIYGDSSRVNNVTSYSNGIESYSYDITATTNNYLLQIATEYLPVSLISAVVITQDDLEEAEDDWWNLQPNNNDIK